MTINFGDFAFFPLEILILFLSFLGIAFIIFALVPLGLQSVVGGWRINSRLSKLFRMRTERRPFDLKTVAGCFDVGSEGEGAASYLRALQPIQAPAGMDLPDIGTADPAERHFSSRKLPVRALRNVGLTIAAVLAAICAFAFGVLSVGEDVGDSAASLLLPASVALLVVFLAQALFLVRWHQLQRCCALLDRLFLVPHEKLLLVQLRPLLEAESASHRVALSAALREATGSAFAAPVARLGEAASMAASDQSERVRHLVEELLNRFVDELTAVSRDQLEQLRAILDAAVSASETLKGSLETALGQIRTDVSEPVRELTERLHETVVEDLQQSAGAIRRAAESLETVAEKFEAMPAPAQPGEPQSPGEAERKAEQPPTEGAQTSARASQEIAEMLRELQRQARDLSGE